MNLFLKNNKSLTRNNHSLKNQYKINTSFKTGINHKNKISFFIPKGKPPELILRIPNESLKSHKIAKTEYSKDNNPINLKQSLINNKTSTFISKSIETNKSSNNIAKYNSFLNSEENITKSKSNKSLFNFENKINNKNNSDKKIKTLLDLQKRNSLVVKEPLHLNKMFGLSIFHKPLRNSIIMNKSQAGTFFTSLALKNNSKGNSQNSKISYSKHFNLRKQYYEAIKLKELKSQVKKFETSESFQPNEQIIEKYLSSPDRFINRKCTKKLHLKNKIKLNYCENQKIFLKNLEHSIPKTKTKKSKKIYEKLNYIEKESDINSFEVKNSKIDSRHEKTEKIFNSLKKLMNDEVNEYLKEITLEYKKEIGDFTFHNGKGIFTNHLKFLKKNEDILAFMLSNDILD